MTPKPPIWMSTMITTWPNGDQKVGVSTTMCPVTQTALVAVNSASMKVAGRPWVATGNESSAVPRASTPPNARAMTRPGVSTTRRRANPGTRAAGVRRVTGLRSHTRRPIPSGTGDAPA